MAGQSIEMYDLSCFMRHPQRYDRKGDALTSWPLSYPVLPPPSPAHPALIRRSPQRVSRSPLRRLSHRPPHSEQLRAALDFPRQDHRSAGARDALDRADLVEQPVESRGRGRLAQQHVVEFAADRAERLDLDDLRELANHVRAAARLDRDADKCLHKSVDHLAAQPQAVVRDHAVALEPRDPGDDRGACDADLLGEAGGARARIVLEMGNDLQIDLVEILGGVSTGNLNVSWESTNGDQTGADVGAVAESEPGSRPASAGVHRSGIGHAPLGRRSGTA